MLIGSLLTPLFPHVVAAADKRADASVVSSVVASSVSARLAGVVALGAGDDLWGRTLDRLEDNVCTRLGLVHRVASEFGTRRSFWLADAALLIVEASLDRLLAQYSRVRLWSPEGWGFELQDAVKVPNDPAFSQKTGTAPFRDLWRPGAEGVAAQYVATLQVASALRLPRPYLIRVQRPIPLPTDWRETAYTDLGRSSTPGIDPIDWRSNYPHKFEGLAFPDGVQL
jgi:hypothetical protein